MNYEVFNSGRSLEDVVIGVAPVQQNVILEEIVQEDVILEEIVQEDVILEEMDNRDNFIEEMVDNRDNFIEEMVDNRDNFIGEMARERHSSEESSLHVVTPERRSSVLPLEDDMVQEQSFEDVDLPETDHDMVQEQSFEDVDLPETDDDGEVEAASPMLIRRFRAPLRNGKG
jgi:hypothetical protein